MEFLKRLRDEFQIAFSGEEENIDEYYMSTPDEVWKEKLTPEQYRVLREAGTEAPGSGEYNLHFDNGIYHCVACNQVLYESSSKFPSRCGWPAFRKEIPNAIETSVDTSYGVLRTEMHCSKCGGHLGHIFKGESRTLPELERHCVNSVCLKFKKNDDEKTEISEVEYL